MADKFTKYVCEAGDCWDSVCTKTYGAGMEFSFQELLDYNREYSDVIIFYLPFAEQPESKSPSNATAEMIRNDLFFNIYTPILPYLVILRFRAERNFADGQLPIFNTLKNAYPKWVLEVDRQPCFHR